MREAARARPGEVLDGEPAVFVERAAHGVDAVARSHGGPAANPRARPVVVHVDAADEPCTFETGHSSPIF